MSASPSRSRAQTAVSRALGLRGLARLVAGTLGGLAFFASAALLLVSTRLHHVSRDLAKGVESVRIAIELEKGLLAHHDSRALAARALGSARIRAGMEEQAEYVTSAREHSVYDELRRVMGRYLADGTEEDFLKALEASERLLAVNVGQAREARAEAARLDDVATSLGFGTAALVLVAIPLFLLWYRRAALLPLVALDETMRRFAGGDLNARAVPHGVPEMRGMAETYNHLANALVRSRLDQLRYIAGIVHDLRNPLAAVQLAAGYISPETPLPPESRIRDLFRIIRKQLDKLNSLVGDVLNSVRIEAGDIELRIGECDARSFVKEAAETFQPMAPGHAIDVHVPDRDVRFSCDRARIEQVLNNLVSNAIKYSPPGSVVEVRLTETDSEVTLAVTDQGEGILPDERQRIFQPFQRASALHEQIPGVGLGLYTSKRIVEAHGGRLELDTVPGRGSTFTVVLPKNPPPAALKSRPGRLAPTPPIRQTQMTD